MVQGLKDVKYAMLQQENDPLEFCVLPYPIPSQIGIPCFPCELPNNFTLLQSNENHTQLGMKIFEMEEESKCIERSIIYPSLRPWRMTSRDYQNNIPISAERKYNCPIAYKPVVSVKYEGQYAGKIEEPFTWNIFKGKFSELIIYDKNDEPRYKIDASVKQLGLIFFLPFYKCAKIKYKIYDLFQRKQFNLDEEIETENLNQYNDDEVGSIEHIFYGWSNECCSKADQYGITFPDDASEQEKALIVMAAIFIDYLWFENF